MSAPSKKLNFLKKWRHALAPYDIGYKVKLVSQLMYRDFLERLEPYGLTPFHYLVLCCLWEEDGLCASAIADKLGQLGATLTGVVDRMEERKLVYRERDPEDRRMIRIWLTSEGERLKDVLPAIGEQTINKTLEGICEKEQALVLTVLDRMILNFS
jgi:MarR family transcriptional regulator, organic hydroperoxide resistance regulator